MSSFDDYVDPIGRPTAQRAEPSVFDTGTAPLQASPAVAAPTEPEVGYGEDIAKGAAGGLGRGVAGTLGIGGTVGNLVRAGLSKAGVPEDYLNTGAAVARQVGRYVPQLNLMTGPDPAQIQQGIEQYTGKFYEPKTLPGQYASTVAEFAPGAILGGGGIGTRAFNTIVPAFASESAGQLTKGTAAEPYARFLAGMGAGPLAGKLVTPTGPASAVRQADVATLTGEGIPLTAGQRTGSKPLQWMEANAADMPGSAGRAAQLNAEQGAAYNRAVTEHLYDPQQLQARGVPPGINLPDPRAVAAGRASLSDEYTRLSSTNQLRSDPQLHADLTAARTAYEANVMPSQRATGARDLDEIYNQLVDKFVAGQGSVPGEFYQAQRSRMGRLAKATNDPELATALDATKRALDAAMVRGLSPADAQAWALNNRRYALMKQTEPAVASAQSNAELNLSPARVAQTAQVGRQGQYASQAGDLDALAQAAARVIKPMPQSGTASRLGMQKLFNIPQLLTSGSGAAAGSLLGPIGIAVGAAAPFVLPRLALSRAGQAYLGNQLMPQNPRDILAQALAQQAISQPSGIAQNQAAREAYEQKRKDDLRKAGL